MKKGMSLHIGLEYIDSEYYGKDAALRACEKDCIDMESIAIAQEFETTKLLLNEEATRDAVKKEILLASEELVSGDLFFISYSGHGSFIKNMDGTEKDNNDQVWCLYDGMFLDDELRQLWTLFSEGVRIFVISDSCHSGTMTKSIGTGIDALLSKQLPTEKSQSLYLKNKEFYDEIKENTADSKKVDIEATVLLISACQDDEVAYILPYAENSLLTTEITEVWDSGQFIGTAMDFFEEIKKRVELMGKKNKLYQNPNYLLLGKKNSAFELQNPFKR